MTVDKSGLISNICNLYGAQGKDIEALKARLEKMSEAELQAELSKALSGNGNFDQDMGLKLERTTVPQTITKEQEDALLQALTSRVNNIVAQVEKAEESNGFLGKAWNWAKNTFNVGDSSNKVRKAQEAELKALQSGNLKEAFKEITGLDYTAENITKFLNNEIQTKSEIALNGYNEGQEMVIDVVADIVSGITAVGIYTTAVAAAPFTGGASIAVGVAAAAVTGAAIKTVIKYTDAKSGGREYTADNLKKDLATGAVSGVLAPITGGMGGAVGKTVATRAGIQAVKQVGKEVAEEAVEQTAKGFVKTALTNPYGYEYVGGKVLHRVGAYSAEMITDGTISGAVDGAFRTAYDGGSLKEVGKSAVMGGISGGAGAWLLGGGIKVFGRGMQKIFGKNDVNLVEYRTEDGRTVIRIDENGNKIPTRVKNTEIDIPAGKLEAPNAKFLETDDAFRDIVRKRAGDIAELDKIQNVDEFLEKGFQIIKEEMGLADSPIKFEITDDINQYDLVSNTVSINRNWADGDKAELFGAMAHELNHFLQWKEVISNYDQDSDYWIKLVSYLQETENGQANIEYIIDKYPDNVELQEFFNKAKSYEESWKNYVEPNEPNKPVDPSSEQYQKYKTQTVEEESFRRGEIVVEEYRKTVSSNSKKAPRPATKAELQDFAKRVEKEYPIVEYKENLIKFAEFDIDVAEVLLKQKYYITNDTFQINELIEAIKLDKQTTIELLSMTKKQNLKGLLKNEQEYLFNLFSNVLTTVKCAQEDYNLTMEVVKFSRNNNLSMSDLESAFQIAKYDKEIALKIYKTSERLSHADMYINALETNRELTLELINIKDKYNDRFTGVDIDHIINAHKKSPAFMDDIHKKIQKKEITMQEYCDISEAIIMLGDDFAYKTVDELTLAQKRILLEEISSWKSASGRSRIIDEMFPCLPKTTDSEQITKTINQLTEELNSKPKIFADSQISKLNQCFEQIYAKKFNTKSLKSIIEEFLPEYKNIIDNDILSKATKMINNIVDNNSFKQLSDNDKKITIISTIVSNLKRNGETQTDIALETYNLVLKMGLDEFDAKKAYSITKASNLIEQFMSTTKKKILHNFNNEFDITNREAVFNQLAFELKENNNFELAKLIYSSNEPEGFTRYLDKLLKNKINEMKADDFLLYQTPVEVYKSKAHLETVPARNGKSYNVMIVNSDEIDDFYAVVHNPNGISMLKGDLPASQRYAKLIALEHIANDRAYCGSYINGHSICATQEGFIFTVPNDKFYVASGHDIGSRSKGIDGVIKEYFIENNVVATTRDYSGAIETKNEERKMVSRIIKEILGISDEEYIRRVDNIKSELKGKVFTPDNAEAIDPEFAKAYREFFSRVNHDATKGKEALLSDGEWNEVIVSNPKIGGIYTTNLKTIPEDMLIFAQDNNLPIVVLKPRKQVDLNAFEQKLAVAKSREDFVAIRDEIKAMPDGAEKQALQQQYLQRYNEWSRDPARPDIRMQYRRKVGDNIRIVNKELYEKFLTKDIITADDVKLLFPDNKIKENSFTQSVKDLINEIPEEVKKDLGNRIIDYSRPLDEQNFETIAKLMNLHKEKHLEKWFTKSEGDNIENIQKLAMFARVIDFTHQHQEFLQFDENQWDIVIEGILKDPEKYTTSVLKYKYNSTEINEFLDNRIEEPKKEIIQAAELISEYLKLFTVQKDFVVYRGEGRYGILGTSNNKNLPSIISNFTSEILENRKTEEDIKNFIFENLLGQVLHQKRFLSTSMTKEAVKKQDIVICWEELTVKEGSHGAFIENFCVERSKEAEFLVQKDANILIKSARFENGIWFLKGIIN